jgi:outer membrane receptor for ferrienterochelin and colicins
MKSIFLLICLIFFFLVNASAGEETGVVRGRVVNAEDHQPLAGASVMLQGTLRGVTTSAGGEFTISQIVPGRYVVVASMVGFKKYKSDAMEIGMTEGAALVISLEPSAVETAPVIVSASKREQFAAEAPVSVSVIDHQTLEDRHTVTVDDALQYVPGVNITQSQVNIRGSSGYSHGVGSRVLVLADGVPLLSGDNGEIVWESIPVLTIDHIEIVKGAGSALYGSSALGGVVNIISRPPAAGGQTTIRTYGGYYDLPSYASWHWTDDARTSGGILLAHEERIGNVTASAGGSRSVDAGYKENDFWKRWNVWSHLGYDFSTVQSLGVDFSYLSQRRGNFLYWKSLTDALQPTDDQLTQRVESDRWRAGLSYRTMISRDAFLNFRGGWFHSRWSDNIPTKFDSVGSLSTSDAATGEIQINDQLAPNDIITGGVTVSANKVDADTIFGHHTATGFAFYVQNEYSPVSALHLTLGVRWDIQKIASIDPFSRVNPKIGVVFSPDDETALRVSVGSGFRIPSIAEVFTTTEAGGVAILPNPQLRPERSWSYELGGLHNWTGDFSTEFSLFRNDLWDLIEPSFGDDGYIHFQNITRAEVTGVEAVIRINLLDGVLPAMVSYTYVDPEDKSAGGLLRYRPRHIFYASLRAHMRPAFVSVDYRYLSRVERIDDELVTLGIIKDGDLRVPISVVDVNAGIEWLLGGTAMSAGLHLKNLLRYYYSDFIGNLGPPRSVVLSLQAIIR